MKKFLNDKKGEQIPKPVDTQGNCGNGLNETHGAVENKDKKY